MDLYFLIALIVSFAFILAVTVASIFSKKVRNNRTFSVWNLFALGIAAALVATFVPVVYYEFYRVIDNDIRFVSTGLLSIINTGRTFLLDGQFEVVRDAANLIENDWLQSIFLFYCAALHLVAPAMTAGYILSLLKNVFADIRFACTKKRKIYVMSVLNDRSKALAKDIMSKNDGVDKKLVVFTGIENFRELDEDNKQFIKSVHAICLKKDVSDLVTKNKTHVEYFLIDEDESRNLNKALKIINNETDEFERCVFVFARSESVGMVLDSVYQGRDVNKFKIRRVDDVHLLTRRTLEKSGIHTHRLHKKKDNDIISLLIVGMGKYGVSFLKNAVWFCQMFGVKVEINVIDKRPENADDNYNVIKEIEHDCPELLKLNDCEEYGEANYSIRFFTGIDCFNSDFDNLFDHKKNPEGYKRLKRTDMVFVSLGDDDLNINAAVMMRVMFDRLLKVNATSDLSQNDDVPMIYSVVYDSVKTENLNIGGKDEQGYDCFLGNQSNIPYNIYFVGCLNDEFTYDKIYEKECEDRAIVYHTEWVNACDDADKLRKKEEIKYELKEYYRISSITKSVHKEAIKDVVADFTLEQRRVTEHMRWNAYMRSRGYIYGPKKIERAKIHQNLVAYDLLSDSDKLKD